MLEIEHLKADLLKLNIKIQGLQKQAHELEGKIANAILKSCVTGYSVYRSVGDSEVLLYEFKTQEEAEEYWLRFMQPHVERAREAGLSEVQIDAMVRTAIDEADGQVTLPGRLLRDMVNDAIESETE